MIDGECNTPLAEILETASISRWNKMKLEMKCLWIECDKTAKDMKCEKLSKCKRCRVARYCSKRCPKLDWKYGDHNNICTRFVEMRLG